MTGTLSDVNHHFYYVQWQGIFNVIGLFHLRLLLCSLIHFFIFIPYGNSIREVDSFK